MIKYSSPKYFQLLLLSTLITTSSLFALSLEEKIGHLLIVECFANNQQATNDKGPFDHEEALKKAIEKYHVSNVLFKRRWKYEELKKKIADLRALSKEPMFTMLDMEWGLSMRLNDVPSVPKSMTLGASRNRRLIEKTHRIIAQQAKAVGINFVLGPVLDVNSNPINPIISDRSFGCIPETVASYTDILIKPYQDARILCCMKHFPGHGDTSLDSHVSLPTVRKSKEELLNCELLPFTEAVKNDAPAIMTAHILLPEIDPLFPATLSETLINQFLRKEMGYTGLIITDDLVMKAISDNIPPEKAALQALQAGCDLIMCSRNIPSISDYLCDCVRNGLLSESLIDFKVHKILNQKRWAQNREEQILPEEIDYIELKRSIYSESLTLLGDTPQIKNSSENVTLLQFGGCNSDALKNLSENKCRYHIVDVRTKSYHEKVDFLILANLSRNTHEQYRIHEALPLIQDLSLKNPNLTVVVMGSPYALQYIPNELRSRSYLIAYESEPEAFDACADYFNRVIQYAPYRPQGILPVIIP